MEQYRGKILKIIWRDAHHPNDDWVSIDNLEIPDTEVITYGVLVKVDEHYIMVAQTLTADKMTAGVFTITKGQIIDIVVLGDH